jgi:hypothetical protein
VLQLAKDNDLVELVAEDFFFFFFFSLSYAII